MGVVSIPREHLASIEQADAKRRALRDAAELEQLAQAIESPSRYAPDHKYVNPELVRGAGVVCPPPNARASERWTATASRCVGTVDGRSIPSVRVIHADGSSEVRTVSSFRKSRDGYTRKATQAVAPKQPEALRYNLAPIGDQNH